MSYLTPESLDPSISGFGSCSSGHDFWRTCLFFRYVLCSCLSCTQLLHSSNGATYSSFSLISHGVPSNHSTKLWYVDSAASNHMTHNPTTLCHVRPYDGQSVIQTANGSSLPIAAIGDASSALTDVFLAPQLSTNLISVGQLVENNYDVKFSGDGCVVQDQVTGEPIPKGPKVGRLFPLFLHVPAFSLVSFIMFFACNNVSDLSMVWHCRLGHPCNTPSPLRLGLSPFFFYNKIFAKIHKVYQST
jgi:hypothetical protein